MSLGNKFSGLVIVKKKPVTKSAARVPMKISVVGNSFCDHGYFLCSSVKKVEKEGITVFGRFGKDGRDREIVVDKITVESAEKFLKATELCTCSFKKILFRNSRRVKVA